MQVSEIEYQGPPPIDSYGGGGFRLNEEFRPGNLILSPAGVATWGAQAGAFTVEDFDALISETADIDVLLVGMGEEIAPLPRNVREAIESAGLGVEVMSTPSACRTYNVLLAEDRRVAVALIAINR